MSKDDEIKKKDEEIAELKKQIEIFSGLLSNSSLDKDKYARANVYNLELSTHNENLKKEVERVNLENSKLKKELDEAMLIEEVEYSFNKKAAFSYVVLGMFFMTLLKKIQDPQFHNSIKNLAYKYFPNFNEFVNKDLIIKILSIYDKIAPIAKIAAPLICLMTVGFVNSKLFKTDMGLNEKTNPKLYKKITNSSSFVDRLNNRFFAGSLNKAKLVTRSRSTDNSNNNSTNIR